MEGEKQHWAEKLVPLSCDAIGCELSADPTGSPGARRTLQRCPKEGVGSLYPNMAIPGYSCLGWVVGLCMEQLL